MCVKLTLPIDQFERVTYIKKYHKEISQNLILKHRLESSVWHYKFVTT